MTDNTSFPDPAQPLPYDPSATTQHLPTQPANVPTSGNTPWAGSDYPGHTNIDYGSTAYDATAPQPSYIQFGDEPPKPRHGRKRTIIASSAIVATLLVGVGAYAGVRAWTGSGIDEPETAMPASVGAFARVDFNPGVGDKLSVNGLVKKFPNADSATDVITKLETNIARQVGLDYNTDVKPWFGGQAGVGVWTENGKPVVLIALSSKDDTKAEATLSKLRDHKGPDSFGFAMESGYALIAGTDGDMQAEATAAANAAKQGSLASDATFRSTVSHVGDGNLLLAYADVSKLSPLLSGAVGQMLGAGGGLLGGSGTALGLPGLGLNGVAAKGQVAIGGKVVDDGVEVRVHIQGASAVPAGTDALATLDKMPSATIAGGAFAGIDPSSAQGKALSGILGGGLFGGGALGGGGFGGGTASGSNPMSQVLLGALGQLLTAKQSSFALTGITPGGPPNMLVTVQARSDSAAASLAGSVSQAFGGHTPDGIAIKQNGATVQATIGSPATGGALGSSALYKETMSGMPSATSALYVDVQGIVAMAGTDMSATDRAQVAPVKAVGFAGSGTDLLVRVVIK